MPDADRVSHVPPTAATAAPTADGAAADPAHAHAALWAALRSHDGLPSVGHTLARLTHLLESDSDAIHELADAILADVALTQRLLRIANTVPYRHGPQSVTTVTRAIALLGFDQVRAVALSLVLLDGLVGDRRTDLCVEFHQSLLAGALARELLGGHAAQEAEEAAIAAMFRGVGRLLVAVHAPAPQREIRQIARRERIAEGAAARRVFGRSYDELTEAVLRDWSVPDRILAAVQPLPPRLTGPASGAERVRAAAQFAEAIAAALGDPSPAGAGGAGLSDVLDRFQPAFALDRELLMPMLERAAVRTRDVELAFGVTPGASPVAQLLAAPPPEAELGSAPTEVSARRDAVGRPDNATEVLVAGLAEATDCLARGPRADTGAVVQVVLEAIFTGLGFARTALVLRDAGGGLFRTRAAFGTPKAQFAFPLQGAPHLFSAVLTHGKDLHIGDVHADKVRARLPDWFGRDFAQAASFLVMPIAVGERVVGFIYADRPVPDSAGPSTGELNLLRALRSQVVLAMRR